MRGKRTYPKAFAAGAGITPAGAGKTKRRKQKRTLSWDHPRRCGENAGQNPNIVRHLGSPPQVRGKRASGGAESPRKRITPAGAGKTHRALHYPRSGRDHPRRCGENPPRETLSTIWSGSPPQVRGKLWWGVRKAYKARITPAGAGKTHIPSIFREIFQDHPRGCGENVLFSFHRLKKLGSPPRMRGKPSLSGITKLYHRITPADAGKTLPRSPQE